MTAGTLALTRSRIGGYTRSRRALAPTIATLALLGIIHAGGAAPMSEAYGVSALILLPVLAWQARLMLDLEPETQRMLATTMVGSARGSWHPACWPPWPRRRSRSWPGWLSPGCSASSSRPARPAIC